MIVANRSKLGEVGRYRGFTVDSSILDGLVEHGQLNVGQSVGSINVLVNKHKKTITFEKFSPLGDAPHLQKKLIGSRIYEKLSDFFASHYQQFRPIHQNEKIDKWIREQGGVHKAAHPDIASHSNIVGAYLQGKEPKPKPVPKPRSRAKIKRMP